MKQAELAGISRSSFYYKPVVSDKTLEIMHKVDEIYTEHPYYGSRRISEGLQREGYKVGRKRARTLMRKMGLVARYPKPNTSKPNKQHKIYPYLLRGYTAAYANDIWSTDITYIRMPKGWVYLIAVIDRYSRKIISRRVSLTLEVGPCIDCLKDALNQGAPRIFNTDQGSQFTSNEFTGILKDKDIQISMDGIGRAIDNIYIERFWRSLKQEEVYHAAYENVLEAKVGIGAYIEKYNARRLHSSIGYRYPVEAYNESLVERRITTNE